MLVLAHTIRGLLDLFAEERPVINWACLYRARCIGSHFVLIRLDFILFNLIFIITRAINNFPL